MILKTQISQFYILCRLLHNILDCLIGSMAKVIIAHTQSVQGLSTLLKQITFIKQCQDSRISTMDSSARHTRNAQKMRHVTF